MHYAISDIHGCYDEFMELLDKIHFSDEDDLFIIGDIIDRGPKPVEILRYMVTCPNIFPILGNHEFMMMRTLPKLMQMVSEKNLDDQMTMDVLTYVAQWFRNGGEVTAEGFRAIPEDLANDLLEYVEEFPLLEELHINEKEYCLIHTLSHDFHENPILEDEEDICNFLFSRPDFTADWDQETIYVIGHTPTVSIGKEYRGKIFRQGNLINIDCGCVFGLTLGAICLETGEEFYVESHQ